MEKNWIELTKCKEIDIDKFNNDNFKEILEMFLIELTGEIRLDDSHNIQNDKYYACHTFLNEKYKNVLLKNIIILEFNLYLLNVLYDIIGEYEFNYKDFGIVFKKVYHLYENCDDYDLKKLLRTWLHFVYGNLNYKILFSNNIDIKKRLFDIMNNIMKKIYEEFQDDVLYIDLDIIYLKNDSDDFVQILNKYMESEFHYSYNIKEVYGAIFLGLKKCIIFDYDMKVFKMKGLKVLDKFKRNLTKNKLNK